MMSLWHFGAAELWYFQCVAWPESIKDTPAPLRLRGQPLARLLPVPWMMFSSVLHPAACCIPGDAAGLPHGFCASCPGLQTSAYPWGGQQAGVDLGWGRGFRAGVDLPGGICPGQGQSQPAEGEFLRTAASVEVLPGETGPSTGLPAKGQQGRRHGACLQKPAGKVLWARGMKGEAYVGIFWGTSQLLSLLLPPLFRPREPLAGGQMSEGH